MLSLLLLSACPPTLKDTSPPTDTSTARDSEADTDTDTDSDTDTDTDSDTDTDTDSDTDSDSDTDTDTDADADTIPAGALVITEIFKNASVLDDANAEWFEIYNPGSSDISLTGLAISDAGGQTFSITGAATIAAGSYFLLANNADATLNGGLPTVDYAYDGTVFQLGNDDDEIILTYNGTIVDQVYYLDAPAWPDYKGFSITLEPSHSDATANDDVLNWCLSTSSFGAGGDFGTPKAINDSCLQ